MPWPKGKPRPAAVSAKAAAAKRAGAAAKYEGLADQVHAFLRRGGTGFTLDELVDALGCQRKPLDQVIRRLSDEGLIRRAGSPHRYFLHDR